MSNPNRVISNQTFVDFTNSTGLGVGVGTGLSTANPAIQFITPPGSIYSYSSSDYFAYVIKSSSAGSLLTNQVQAVIVIGASVLTS